LRILGLCAFLVSFFLPAVNTGDIKPHPVSGWLCAAMTLLFTAAIPGFLHVDSVSGLLYGIFGLLSGWVNPLILIYLFFAFRGTRPRLRRNLLGAILICLSATVGFFVNVKIAPGGDTPGTLLLVGYYVWVAGIILMLGPDLANLETARKRTLSPKMERPGC
jgi:hypothetical protein